MKTALLMGLLCILISSLPALTGNGYSSLGTLDTVHPTLALTSPNGGEAWYIGDTHAITWTASDSNLNPNSIYLWYSMNGGTAYTSLVVDLPNSLSYPWLLPSQQSYNARVRLKVSDNYGNFTYATSAAPFSITYVPPADPQNVIINTSNNVDAVLSWQPVTQTIYATPLIPDGYIILYNETPYEDARLYYFLGRSFTTSYTHHDVAEFRSQMYYRVVAYKNYRDENLSRLEQLATSKPLLWKDALQTLVGGE